jgi:hypothetical protein
VPDTAATVTLARPNKSPNAFDTHANVVEDVQDDVKHTPRSPPPPGERPAVAVCSLTPKLSPDTVIDAYPLCSVFSRASETIAASKLNAPFTVPTTPPTVTHVVTSDAGDATSYAGCIRQLTVVAELQLDVTHTAPESTDVCV